MIGGAALALLASVFLGVGDYLGGVLSRRLPLVTVLIFSQLVATVAILPRMFWEDPSVGWEGALLWGLIGGVATAVGVSSLYAALASGTMGVVAPITSLSVFVPVAAGLAGGDQLSWLLGLGLIVAIAGTILASGPEVRNHRAGHGPKPIILALVSAVGFGFANVSVAFGSAYNITTTLVSNSLTVLLIYAIALLAVRQVPVARGRALVGVISIGLLGISAQLCFAIASTTGALSVVGVLASLYPVVTVLLGWRLLGERLLRIQVVGVIAVFLGIAVVAATA